MPGILKLPNKTSEKLQVLKHEEKQMLCLIKASLSDEKKIIIIEFPDPNIQKIINQFITRELSNKTILIMGTNHRHFEICNRIVNLNMPK